MVSLFAGSYIVPRPWVAVADAGGLLLRLRTWSDIGLTLSRLAAGFGSALVAGVLVGLAVTREAGERMLKPAILLIQGVPPILWAIPLILLFGIGHVSPVLVIALICFPLVALNIGEGMRSVPVDLREMLGVFAPGRKAYLRELVIPHLRPFLSAAVKLGLTLGIKASVVAEYFAANNGIGFRIQSAYQAFQIRSLFAWALLLVLLILAVDGLTRTKPARLRRVPQSDTTGDEDGDCRDLIEGFQMRRETEGRLALGSVGFSYGDQPMVIADIDLEVGTDEVVVLFGDSGVGKTTLLRVAAGISAPSTGAVERPKGLGFVFQNDRFLPWRNNVQNVALPCIYGGQERQAGLCFARYLMMEVGLAEVEYKYPDELSGGMGKRLALARCFASMPDAVFMDEPFTGLHEEARTALWELFADLLERHPAPTIVVTHFPEEVPNRLAARHYRLEGSPARLRGL